jgi:hypothetical protein
MGSFGLGFSFPRLLHYCFGFGLDFGFVLFALFAFGSLIFFPMLFALHSFAFILKIVSLYTSVAFL